MKVSPWLIAFDVDGTLLKSPSSSWRLIHEILGTVDKAKQYAQLYEKGKISYEEWARLDASLWKGQDYEALKHKVLNKVVLREGALELAHAIKKYNMIMVLVSAGLSIVVDYVSMKLNADYSFSNKLIVKDGKITGDVDVIVDFYGKDKILQKIISTLGIPKRKTIAVGDDENDISMFKFVNYPIAFNPNKESILRYVDYVVYSETLFPVKALIIETIVSRERLS